MPMSNKNNITNLFVSLFIILFLHGFTGAISTPSTEPGDARYVNPFIGTGGHGHTYPGAALPFGMVQLSPDTRLSGWDGCSGYHFSDSIIYGFSHTHLSGTGVSDYGDILFMPFVGKPRWNNGSTGNKAPGYCSSFSHQRETAEPGYYRVHLEEHGIDVQLTATTRVGVHRYTFPSTQQAHIIIDLTHRDAVIRAGLKKINQREIEGFRRSCAWAKDQHVYFVARFSKPFKQYLTQPGKQEKHKAILLFDTTAGETIEARVGISAVSIDGARKNLEKEAAGKTFLQLRKEARRRWNNHLGKIKVTGGTPSQRKIFYTSMYHAMLNPNIYMDVDGSYRGRDQKVHNAQNFSYYTVFSLWDTFRTLHPLFAIIEPERTNHFIRTFITQYEQGGLLPVWELSANETFCMIGYHAVPVIVDAYVKGLREYDAGKAYEAVKHSAGQDHLGLEFYKKRGYIPAGEEAESVSKTLEYAYDDWCIAQMALALGKTGDYTYYLQRAQYYKNLFDPSTGFMRARMKGAWFTPFDPAEVNFNYTEANAWQYRFYVPQDIHGLIRLLRGPKKFSAQLDALFQADSHTKGRKQADITGLIGQYAHGNEPSHHMAYLYNYVGQPWKTQQQVRRILDTLYTDKPDGLCGNEDCGQMSAWYIMSALGFYPVTPGSDVYVIGTPLFEKATLDIGKGGTFTVTAANAGRQNIYIQSARLNGKPLKRSWFRHSEILQGGALEFVMGSAPNKKWGGSAEALPPSAITQHLIVPVPHIVQGNPMFKESTTVSLASLLPGAELYYTLDGSKPSAGASKQYRKPIFLDRSATIKAIAAAPGFPESHVLTARFHKISTKRTIRLDSTYAPQYSGGGDTALIDGLRGGRDFRTGTWQGYEGSHLEAVIDLGESQKITQLAVGFLQDNNAWIFMPEQVEYFISADGKDFQPVALVKNDIPHRREGTIIKNFTAVFSSREARYVKVFARSIETCPSWHKGAGHKSWIFADEICVR